MCKLEKDLNTGQWMVYGTPEELSVLWNDRGAFYDLFMQIPEKDRTMIMFQAFIPTFAWFYNYLRLYRDK